MGWNTQTSEYHHQDMWSSLWTLRCDLVINCTGAGVTCRSRTRKSSEMNCSINHTNVHYKPVTALITKDFYVLVCGVKNETV